MSASQVALQVVRLGVAMLLARLLAPADFGLVAMALVITNFLDIFKDLGTKAAIIQRSTLSRDFASSVFVVNVVIGLGLTLLIAVLAAPIASFYGEPALAPVLQAMACVIGVSSVGLVHQAHLYRVMAFRKLAIVHFSLALMNAVVAVTFALNGLGVWALVFGTLAGSLSANVLVWVLSDLRLRWHFSWQDVREIAGFSLNLSTSQVFGVIVGNADKFIVGKVLGAAALGHYNIAQRILMYPVRSVTQVLQEVLLPTMARLQGDNRVLADAYIRALCAIALLTFPAMVGIAVVAEPFVLGVLGERWRPAIPVIVLIAPVGAIQSLTFTTSVLYTVTRRTDWLLRWTVVAGTFTVLAYVAGLRWGIVGVAAAFAIVNVLLIYPAFAIPFKLIEARFRDLSRALMPYSLMSLAMGGTVLVARLLLEAAAQGHVVVLVVSVAVGMAVYGVLMLVFRPPALWELLRLVRPR